MKLFLVFIFNLALSLFASILIYQLFKVDVSPVTISLATIVIYICLPQRFHDWMSEK
jgi:hypothetical protein